MLYIYISYAPPCTQQRRGITYVFHEHILKYVGVMNADENFGEEKIFSGGLNNINPIIRGTLTMTEYLSTL